MTSWLEPLGQSRARRACAKGDVPAGDGRGDRGSMEGVTTGGAPAPPVPADERAAQEILAAFALRRPAPGPDNRSWYHAGSFDPYGSPARPSPMNAAIVRLDAPLEPEISLPSADRVLAGSPEHRAWNYFTDSTGTFFAGRWSGTRGKWRIRYTENELCVMTAGRVVITSDQGERNAFGPGDAFVIPAGFCGTWEVLEDCAKVYAIFEPRS